MATVERRNQGGTVRYRVRWWADGKQRSKTFQREAEAKRFKAVLEGDTANGSWVDPKQGQETVLTFTTAWLETVHDLRPTSKEQVRSCLWNHVLPEFGSLPLCAVTHAHVQQWTTRQVGHLSGSTIRKNVFAFRRVLQAAVRQDLIRTNPTTGISLPSASRLEQRFLDRGEVTRLADTIKPRYRAMVLVAAYGGLRFGELCALRRSSVNVLKNTVAVRETLVDLNGQVSFGPPKTKGSSRLVTLPSSVMREVAEHMDSFTDTEGDALLFTFANGAAIRRSWFRQRVWLPALTKAELQGLRFHDLRHTFVALWVSLGRNAKEVSTVAGHSSVAFTLDRYGHLYDVPEDDLGDKLDLLLGA